MGNIIDADKELLLKDLYGRLSYGVKLKIGEYSDYKLIGIIITDEFPIKVEVVENDIPYRVEVPLDIVKPCLRPMSSMTEEELSEFRAFHCLEEIHPIFYPQMCNLNNINNMYDWLNAHHFDYNGLIEKGLALEASEGMYNNLIV